MSVGGTDLLRLGKLGLLYVACCLVSACCLRLFPVVAHRRSNGSSFRRDQGAARRSSPGPACSCASLLRDFSEGQNLIGQR